MVGSTSQCGLFDLLELGVQPLANDVPSDQPLALPDPPEGLGEGQDVMLSADGFQSGSDWVHPCG